jgi:hypothetical protein
MSQPFRPFIPVQEVGRGKTREYSAVSWAVTEYPDLAKAALPVERVKPFEHRTEPVRREMARMWG